MIKKITLIGTLVFGLFSGLNSQVIVSEGFEGTTASFNWINAVGNSTNFTTDTVLFHNGSKSVTDSYVASSFDTLYQSGVVDLTTATNPQLIFWHICKLEGGYDDGKVYISTDSGITYTVLPSTSYMGLSSGADGFATAGHFDEDSYAGWGTASGTPTNTWWKREAFNLGAYIAFTKVKIMFVLKSDASVQKHGWNLDDISIESVPCPLPTGLTSFGTGSDTTNLTWVTAMTDTLWQVEYDTAGFTQGTGTFIGFSTADTVSIGGLTPNTTYDFYVRNICTGGDTSGWMGASQFTTACVTIAAPYTQNFDAMTISGVGFGCYANDDLSDCWTNDLTPTNKWAVLSGPTGSGSTGPPSDHTTTSGNYIYLETSSCSGITSTAFSPTLDISALTNPQLSFYYHMYGATMGTLKVYVTNDNGTTWSAALFTKTGDQGNSWQEGIVSLTSYIGDTIQIKFEGLSGTSFTSDMAIDDIIVDNVPTCPKPTGLTNYTLSSDSVDLTWINGANDSTWILEYGTGGFTLGTGTTISSTNDSVPVGGLTPNTTYDVYLRSFCDVADTSLWFGPFTFTTPCASYTPPYMEDYTTYSFSTLPACWEEAKGQLTVASTLVYGTSSWGNRNFANNGLGNNAAVMNIYSTARYEWLISPSIDLGTGSTPYQVEFDVAITDYFNSSAPTAAGGLMGPDDKLVLIISTDNGVTWSDTNILEQWDTANMPTHTGDYFYYNLTAAGYTGIVKLGLYAESTISNEDNDAFVDNFAVVQVPTCPRPQNLAMDSATTTNVYLSWTNGAADSTWIFEYGSVGFTQGTGTIANSTTNPATITGLTASTCYDVYMRSFCDIADTSLWIGPLKVCTDCAPVVDLCEDFETTSSNDLPICWSKYINSTGSTSIGVSNFGGYASSNKMQLNSGSGGSAAVMMLITPEMTALDSASHRINFWAKFGSTFGTPDSVLYIGTMTDPTNPATYTAFDTINTIDGTWQNYKINFDTYTGSDKYIAFLYNPTGSFDRMDIDEFCFEEIPSCEKPPSVTILNAGVDSNYLNLGWNIDTSFHQTSFIITYGPAGFTPGDASVIGTVTSTSNFKSVTGLTPLTEYCFWVKAVCANGDTSFWDGPHCGFTGCPSSTSLTYTQDMAAYAGSFAGDVLPQCWEEARGALGVSNTPFSSTTSSNWTNDNFGNAGTDNAAKMNIYATGRNEWLISPSINLGSTINRHIIVEFDVALTDYNNATTGTFGDDDTLALVISRDNGVTWNTANIIALFDTGNAPSNTGDHITIDLPNETGVVKFGFYAASSVSNEDNDVFIDNFKVYDTTYVGIDEISQDAQFKVFPNPNDGIFTVLNEGNSLKSNLKIIDIQGRLIYEESNYFGRNGRKVINLNEFTSGVYILLIQSEGKTEQHRIIIE